MSRRVLPILQTHIVIAKTPHKLTDKHIKLILFHKCKVSMLCLLLVIYQLGNCLIESDV